MAGSPYSRYVDTVTEGGRHPVEDVVPDGFEGHRWIIHRVPATAPSRLPIADASACGAFFFGGRPLPFLCSEYANGQTRHSPRCCTPSTRVGSIIRLRARAGQTIGSKVTSVRSGCAAITSASRWKRSTRPRLPSPWVPRGPERPIGDLAAVEALESGSVTRIVLSRLAVEAGENLGFLPATCAKSSIPPAAALRRLERPDGPAATPEPGRRNHRDRPRRLHARPHLNNSFVLIDEAQNCTRRPAQDAADPVGLAFHHGDHRRPRPDRPAARVVRPGPDRPEAGRPSTTSPSSA